MKASPFVDAFNAGEFSPRMDARISFEKYPSAFSRGKNLVCLPQGGATFRPGTRYVADAKLSTSASHLFPFNPVADQAYIFEAGESFLRFYRNQGRLAVEATSSVIANGTFDADISSWTNISTGGGTIAWNAAGALLEITGAADGVGWAQQQVTVAAGDLARTHSLRFDVPAGVVGTKMKLRVGSTSGGFDILDLSGLGIGTHVISFVPNGANLYIQFGNDSVLTGYIDNVSFTSGVPLELTTPYTAAQAADLHRAQSADIVYLFHPSHRPRKLERRGDRSWSLVQMPLDDGPWLDINPDTDLAAANLIKNSTFDSGVEKWEATATGTGFVEFDAGQKVVFLRRHDTTGTARLTYTVATGASAALHVLHFQIVGGGTIQLSVGTTSGGAEIRAAQSYPSGWYTVSFTPSAATFYVDFEANQDKSVVGGVGAAFCYTSYARFLSVNNTTAGVTLTATGHTPFAATDIGRAVRLEWPGREPAWGIITAYTSSSSVTLWLRRDTPTIEPTETWRLGAWSDTTGWPSTGVFHQQRLFAAGVTSKPQSIWASQSGDFENFRPDSWEEGTTTVHDDDALSFTVATQRVSPIRWLASVRRLVIGTSAGLWAAASRGAALTPTDFAVEPQTSVPVADNPPMLIDDAIVFIPQARASIYDAAYRYETESFQAADLTILADHLCRSPVEQIVHQAEPYSTVWGRKDDGTLIAGAYKRAHNVIGWTPVVLSPASAVVESLAVIPGADDAGQTHDSGDRDELWLSVRHTSAGGTTRRQILVMEGYFVGPNRAEYTSNASWKSAMLSDQQDAFFVDAGLTYDGSATLTITGLDHLEGETVKVLADGDVQTDKTVSGGSITLDVPASKVQVGFGYDWSYRSLKMAYGAQTGPGIGKTKALYGVELVLLDGMNVFNYGVEVDNGVTFYTATISTDAIPALFTGEYRIDLAGGYDRDVRFHLAGAQPLPFTLLGIVPNLRTNEHV